MKKNDVQTLSIYDYSTDGFGIAKADNGMTVFIPGGAVGDTANVLILKVLKNYCFGKIIDIVKPSDERIKDDCEVFKKCGGCCYRHISYPAELNAKHKRVKDAIERIGGITHDVDDVLSNGKYLRYRNKGQYPIRSDKNGIITAGFYSLHSHRIIPCDDCILQPKEFSQIISACLDFFNSHNISAYNEQTGKGLIRHIYLRKSDYEQKVSVCIVINGNTLPYCEKLIESLKKFNFISGLILNINTKKSNVILGEKCITVFGKGYITEQLLETKFNISPLAFFQVNRKMTEILYQKAAEYADAENKTILDLFCGAGTIGLTMAKKAKKIIGVEIVPQAVKNAEENAKINNINNAEFICSTAENAAKVLAEKNVKTDVVILDPPRKGATNDLINTICNKFSPERVVYISCDPATLARDLKIFNNFGYKTQKITPVNLFPRTAHIETVVMLSHK